MNYQEIQTEQEQEIAALRASLVEARAETKHFQSALDEAADDYYEAITEGRRLKMQAAELEAALQQGYAIVARYEPIAAALDEAGCSISWQQTLANLANCLRVQRRLLAKERETTQRVREALTDYLWLGYETGKIIAGESETMTAAGQAISSVILAKIGGKL